MKNISRRSHYLLGFNVLQFSWLSGLGSFSGLSGFGSFSGLSAGADPGFSKRGAQNIMSRQRESTGGGGGVTRRQMCYPPVFKHLRNGP